MAWKSGNRARKPILRLLPIMLVAITMSVAFGLASIFSSNVTSETLNQVLLKGTRCGSVNGTKANSVYKTLTLLLPFQAEKANRFLNYGLQCYTNEPHTDGCNLYTKPRLPLKSTRGVACPFKNDICKMQYDNLMMDTGYLDSLEHLGINAAPTKRFQIRMVSTCAPLKTEEYMGEHNDSDYGPLRRYFYGRVQNVNQIINWTYEVPINHAFLPGDNTSSANIPRLEYSLGVEKHYATLNESLLPGINMWSPIDALESDDADVHLLFMSAPELHYAEPVDDPWFSAHKNASDLNDQQTRSKFSAWVQDEPVGVMGCTHQFQYCNPNLPADERCEPLRGMVDPRASERVHQIFPKDDQFEVIKWVDSLWTAGIYTISATVSFVGASALRARLGLSHGYSAGLPDNQWQLEAEHWLKGALASLQDVFVEAANGLPEALEDFRQPPAPDEMTARDMCSNQKVVSTNYSSFNVLGLILIFGLGFTIFMLDICVERVTGWWQHRKHRRRQLRDEYYANNDSSYPLYGALEWTQTGIFQLQRLAQEEAGYAEWSGCNKDVPFTVPGEMLASLDLRKIDHPRLKRRSTSPVTAEDTNVAPFRPWIVDRSDRSVETLVQNDKGVRGDDKAQEREENVRLVVEYSRLGA